MPRYIDADELAIKFRMLAEDPWNKDTGATWSNAYEECADEVDEFPTADVVERKRGIWVNRSLNIVYREWERYTCSVCGKHAYAYDFCPNCGADMRGEENEG